MLRQPEELKTVFRESINTDTQKTPSFSEILETWNKVPVYSNVWWILRFVIGKQLRIKKVLSIVRADIDFKKDIINIKSKSGCVVVVDIVSIKQELKKFLDDNGIRNQDRLFFSDYKNVESAYRMFRYKLNNKYDLTQQESNILINTDFCRGMSELTGRKIAYCYLAKVMSEALT